LIGSGGLLASSAAGFLYSQRGDDVLAVLSFDTASSTTTSRAGGRVAALTNLDTSSPNLLFSITAADSLTSVRFANYTTAGAPDKTVFVSLPAGTTGALVSFNAATGKVSSVLPYAANRSIHGLPEPTSAGHSVVLHGRFMGAFDAAGEDHAPQGAGEVRLDRKTGEILSAQ
jgi:hypothetical protein